MNFKEMKMRHMKKLRDTSDERIYAIYIYILKLEMVYAM